MTARYPYSCIIKYVPSRYESHEAWLLRNRRRVYDFKDGNYDGYVMHQFLRICQRHIQDMGIDWTVCFAPCSVEQRAISRFSRLYEFLKENLPCEVHLDTFAYLGEKFPSYLWGKREIDNADIGADISHFFGKHVILIDDVISTGKTFNKVCNLIMKGGALSVRGLFYSKTIYPSNMAVIKTKPRIRSR